MMLSAEHIPRHHTGAHWENQASSRLSAPPLVTWHPQRVPSWHSLAHPPVDLRRSGTMNRGLDAPPRPWYVPVSPWAGPCRLGVLLVQFWPPTPTYSMPITTRPITDRGIITIPLLAPATSMDMDNLTTISTKSVRTHANKMHTCTGNWLLLPAAALPRYKNWMP